MTIDSNSIKDPSGLKEYYEYIRNDNVSLNGTLQRNQINKKKVAELSWNNIYPDELALLLAWADDTNSHAYSNTQSKYGTWAFTGIVTITDDGEYMQGGSYMQTNFAVKIREV